jgi:uncharacterized protein
MIDLSFEHLLTVKRILAAHLTDCEVRVFGSRVLGTVRTFSDLDLAICCKKNLPEGLLEALKDAFAESDLPFQVDVIDWNDVSERFRKRISEKYDVLAYND